MVLPTKVTATRDGSTIKIQDDQFGKKHVSGMQQKGFVELDGDEKFVKLDTLSPNQAGNWKDRYDFKYSSVSEAMVSCLTNNLKNTTGRTVDYQFNTFEVGGEKVSGTVSKNFLDNEHEVEINMGINGDHGHGQFESNNQYAEEVVDAAPNDRLNNMTKRFVEAGVDESEARKFLVQQAGFDVLVGNNDRLENPGNFSVVYNFDEGKAEPLNMDYGRCLQLPTWTDTMEDKLDMNAEFIDEMNEENAEDLLGESMSITGSSHPAKSLEFLKENGFEPFQIDMEGFKKDLAELNDKIQASDLPFKKFAQMKMNAFEQVFEREDTQALFEDASLELNLDGLDAGQAKGLE